MKKILEQLFQHQYLSKQQAENVIKEMAKGQLPEAQIAAFLTVFNMRPISLQELKGFRKALLDLAVPVNLSTRDTVDMCGTGGDGKNTFNISTLSAFIVAGAGYKVTKHGNYGVSSVSGSSNVLEQLGYQFTNDENILQQQLDTANITFLHAPKFHPAMAAVGPARRGMGMKTFFNMLGPIVNPAKPKYQLAGVFNLALARLYQYLFQDEADKKFAVIYGLSGYDEISLTDDFVVKTQKGERLLAPEDLGLNRIKSEDIHGGHTVEEAVEIFKTIISGKGSKAQNDVVCANAAMAINLFKPETDFKTCFDEAQAALLEGKALKSLQLITT
ncbi:MAG TPA: anthranilate phosphoribosyltransferase [Flavobacteriales bacterium]|nr:anthranilate phosphoribosyltransferase [Flavobacteriales bacterium]